VSRVRMYVCGCFVGSFKRSLCWSICFWERYLVCLAHIFTGMSDFAAEISQLNADGGGGYPKSSELSGEKDPVKAMAAKEEGNNYFRAKDYDNAIEFYSQAINLCPNCDIGEDFEELDVEEEAEEFVEAKQPGGKIGEDVPRVEEVDEEAEARAAAAAENARAEAARKRKDMKPVSKNAEMLATFLSNRAACFAALGEWDMVVDDCNYALDVHPRYTKVLVRRSQAQEKLEKTDEALADMKRVQELDPAWPKIAGNLTRLEVLHAKRMEEMKNEALGKLKDLGNSLLGNFGMSLDQFNFQQDPTTGSWSMGSSTAQSGVGKK
jgi:tetratricopeptide (TPR) repeat protein